MVETGRRRVRQTATQIPIYSSGPDDIPRRTSHTGEAEGCLYVAATKRCCPEQSRQRQTYGHPVDNHRLSPTGFPSGQNKVFMDERCKTGARLGGGEGCGEGILRPSESRSAAPDHRVEERKEDCRHGGTEGVRFCIIKELEPGIGILRTLSVIDDLRIMQRCVGEEQQGKCRDGFGDANGNESHELRAAAICRAKCFEPKIAAVKVQSMTVCCNIVEWG
ncbi:hypothetical protein LXA43DRAFT_29191 [Ganoderma leucocontextum]|nr:hypothetical protein LXA43DRAFT_29191 [Ganoderma leucocontextum]